jgi:predicted dienelactone hydrolase
MIGRRAVPLAVCALAAPARSAALRDTWRDAARNRDIPVLLRLPERGGTHPLVILSHGLGGSREGLGYLGRALAEAGFIALHIQHAGSDEAVWRGAADRSAALAAAVLDVGNAEARLRDGVFVVADVLRRAALPGDPLAGRVDGTRLAAVGHSFGAWTVQHLLGQRLPGGDRGLPLPERRLRAGIALSPTPPRGLPPRAAFARVAVPMLHLTGTEDHGFIEGATPADREIPFRAIEGAPQALAVLWGARHGAFADQPDAGARWAEPTYHARTSALAVLFLNAVLNGDGAARAALAAGAPHLLAERDRLEAKGF